MAGNTFWRSVCYLKFLSKLKPQICHGLDQVYVGEDQLLPKCTRTENVNSNSNCRSIYTYRKM